MTSAQTSCPGCGLAPALGSSAPATDLPVTDLPVTGLPGTSASASGPAELNASWFCWQTYREVLRHEYRDAGRWPLSGLTRAAYAAQHPGAPGRESLKSLGLHLLSLHFVFERGCNPARLQRVRQAAEDRLIEGFVWLEPPPTLNDPAELQVHSLLDADEVDRYQEAVRAWASSVWERWSPHHTTIARWADWLIAASPPHFIADLAS